MDLRTTSSEKLIDDGYNSFKLKLNFSSFVSEKTCSYADDYKLGVLH